MPLGRIGFTGMRMTSMIIVFVISLIVYSLLVWLGVKIADVGKRKSTLKKLQLHGCL